MGLGLAFKCFFAALGGGDKAVKLEKAVSGVAEPPQIREVIKEVVKEVPVIKEVVKEVIREVPKEVIREVPKEIIREVIKEVPKEVVRLQPDTHGPALLLALLQQDGRLVDFLNEDIAGYEDDQIGAAVREIHTNTRKALRKYVTIEPVRSEAEGANVTIQSGYDASAIRLTGRAVSQLPVTGVVRHRGWKASKVELPPRPSGADPTIVMPAEVEIE